jgi:hypothetical protein
MEPKKEIFWRFFFFSRPRWELALHRWFPLFFFLLLLISKNINSIFSFRPFFSGASGGRFFVFLKWNFSSKGSNHQFPLWNLSIENRRATDWRMVSIWSEWQEQ